MNTLPIFSTVRDAYSFVWAERRHVWSLLLPPVVIIAIFNALLGWSAFTGDESVQRTTEDVTTVYSEAFLQAPGWVQILVAFSTLLYVGAFCLYSVAWHRRYLVPAEAPSVGAAYRWQPRQSGFLWAYFRLILVVLPAVVVWFAIGLPLTGLLVLGSSLGLFALVALIVFAWLLLGTLYARLAILLPAASVEHQMTLKEGWAMTDGNGWRMMTIITCVTVPVWLVIGVFNLILAIGGADSLLQSTLTGSLVVALIDQTIGFVGVAVGVSALSIVYAKLSQTGGITIEHQPAAGPPTMRPND